jgi:hypothetical protein
MQVYSIISSAQDSNDVEVEPTESVVSVSGEQTYAS